VLLMREEVQWLMVQLQDLLAVLLVQVLMQVLLVWVQIGLPALGEHLPRLVLTASGMRRSCQ